MSLHPDDISELQRLKRKLETLSGPGVSHSRRTVTVSRASQPATARARRTSDVVWVRITATEDGGGKYQGVLLRTPTPSNSDATTSQTDFGTAGRTIYIVNSLERDRATHDLSLIEGDRPKDFLAKFLYNDTVDGTPTYGIVGFQIEDCADESTVSGGTF